jgi:hypothetical protein
VDVVQKGSIRLGASFENGSNENPSFQHLSMLEGWERIGAPLNSLRK